MPQKYEIYLAELPIRDCDDTRPWVVIDGPFFDSSGVESVTLAPISSAMHLMRDGLGFPLRPDDRDFASTGLRRESYVIDGYPSNVPIRLLRRKLGVLAGEVLDDFRRWSEGM